MAVPSPSGMLRLSAFARAIVILLVMQVAAGMALAGAEEPVGPGLTPVTPTEYAPHDSPFRIILDAAYLYGPIEGSLQTPSGGVPGTSSAGRPTLSELGIKDAGAMDAQLTVGLGLNEMFLGGQFIRLSGSATLEQPLVSANTAFPAGAEVNSNVQLDWYRLGYRRWILIDLDDHPGPDLGIAPSIGAGLLSFDYSLDGPNGIQMDRHYAKPMPQIGLDAEWFISDRFSVVGEVLWSPPITDTPSVFAARLAGKYRVVDSHVVTVDALLGVGYTNLHYDDGGKQAMPNDITVNFGPQLILGLQVTF